MCHKIIRNLSWALQIGLASHLESKYPGNAPHFKRSWKFPNSLSHLCSKLEQPAVYSNLHSVSNVWVSWFSFAWFFVQCQFKGCPRACCQTIHNRGVLFPFGDAKDKSPSSLWTTKNNSEVQKWLKMPCTKGLMVWEARGGERSIYHFFWICVDLDSWRAVIPLHIIRMALYSKLN